MAKSMRAQIRAQLKKVNSLSCRHLEESHKLVQMCEEYYGGENYNDHDKDEIIDCLDYGTSMIPFEDFDRIMKEINEKGDDPE
jgi:hypothetical protein